MRLTSGNVLQDEELQGVERGIDKPFFIGAQGQKRIVLTCTRECNSNNPNGDFQDPPKTLTQKLTLSSRTDQLADIRAQVARLAGPGKPEAYGTLGDLLALVREGGNQ